MKHVFIIIILSFNSIILSAQLVNIEKERKDYKQGFQGTLAFNFKYVKNTSTISTLGNTINIQYTHNKHTLLLLNDFSIMKLTKDNNNIDLINKNFQHFRYNYSIIDTNKLTFESFFQRQQNKIKYLKIRLLFGSGLRYRIINTKKFSWYLATLLMYENEVLTDSLQTVTKMLKADIYTSLSINISDNLTFSNVTYYQPALVNLNNYPDFERFKDFRIYSETSFGFQIFKHLEYSFGIKLSYDSRPPLELVSTPLFMEVKNILSYKF